MNQYWTYFFVFASAVDNLFTVKSLFLSPRYLRIPPYNYNSPTAGNDDFYNNIMKEKFEMEENMEKSDYENNQEINTEVSLDEIINIISELKRHKATGLDNTL